jgi:hypothetical protein
VSDVEITLGILSPNDIDGTISNLEGAEDEFGDPTLRFTTDDGRLDRITVRITDGDTRTVYLIPLLLCDFTEIRDADGKWTPVE